MNTKELAQVLGLSVRGVESLRKNRRIPAIKLGHRTYRYDVEAVQRALERFTVREVGADTPGR